VNVSDKTLIVLEPHQMQNLTDVSPEDSPQTLLINLWRAMVPSAFSDKGPKLDVKAYELHGYQRDKILNAWLDGLSEIYRADMAMEWANSGPTGTDVRIEPVEVSKKGKRLAEIYAEIREKEDEEILNPFSLEYAKKEIEYYGLESYENEGVEITTRPVIGRNDDYLRVQMYIPDDDLHVPILKIDGTLWMSLTPMEIQSQYPAIKEAFGTVGIGGLGLGYATLRIMEKPEVESVKVYEKEPRIIEMFKNNFSGRKGFEKVEFIVGDVREISGESFEVFYCDIYQTMLPDEVLEDEELLTQNNKIHKYMFWGEELVYYALVLDEQLNYFDLSHSLSEFFEMHDENNTENLRAGMAERLDSNFLDNFCIRRA
jgi:hypothetical protein